MKKSDKPDNDFFSYNADIKKDIVIFLVIVNYTLYHLLYAYSGVPNISISVDLSKSAQDGILCEIVIRR